MHRVFNCGVGMVLAVAAKDVSRAIASLAAHGEKTYDVGEIVARRDGEAQAIVA
jgi:phosphoribosylformylglycinamidine cyclo-ligase